MFFVAAFTLALLTPPTQWKPVATQPAKGVEPLGAWVRVSNDPFDRNQSIVVWRVPFKSTAVEFVAENASPDASWKSGGPLALCDGLQGVEAVWGRKLKGEAIDEHSVYAVKDGYAYIATYSHYSSEAEVPAAVAAVRSLCP